MKTLISVFFPVLLASVLWASPEMSYHQLFLKDLDQMSELVNEKISASKADGGDIAPLRAGLQIVLSRPDDDFMIDKIIGPLRQELDELESWEKTIQSLVDEAISGLKNDNKLKPAVQVTYAVLLTNVVSQLKPRAQEKGFERNMIEKIQRADIRLTKAMRDERRLRTMKDSQSPSTLAEEALTPLKKK